jgi:hypothetical protein
MLSRIDMVVWGSVAVLVLFRAAVVVATGKPAMVGDPVSWDRSLKFWDH